jgi:FkbM family methyltransferase
VLAVEPDGVTIDALKRNCVGNERIVPVHAALWSHEKGVNLRPADAPASWAQSVEEGGSAPSRRLDLLLAEIPRARLLLIKLDIEGAEREVCSSAQELMSTADCILIEPHDLMLPGASCLAPLYSALAGRIRHGAGHLRCDRSLSRSIAIGHSCTGATQPREFPKGRVQGSRPLRRPDRPGLLNRMADWGSARACGAEWSRCRWR